METLYTARGAAVQVGRELGRGGEAIVFELPALNDQVAKLYHRPPDDAKQAKLSFMADSTDPTLGQYAAWPQDTLHVSPGGAMVGFLMPKVVGRDEVHTVYSPAQRQRERPTAAWNFLLFVARNTAVAFDAVHSHGHVLGDVNQKNVMVGSDSRVVLIDCDSCQVNAHGTLHLCEVGVSDFTPPELQGLSSFHGVKRSANHDNFGLALIIFHLLFGGRHPYSGIPLRDGVGDALGADIRAFRYAYSRDGTSRGISPPPRAIIPSSIVPFAVEAMFHAAFTEGGSHGRPTAKNWVDALDGLRGRLKHCGASAVHVYPDHVATCPWCSLERRGIVYFFDLANCARTATGFVLERVWALIDAVPPPPAIAIPSIVAFKVTPTPLPSSVPSLRRMATFRALAVVALLVIVVSPFIAVTTFTVNGINLLFLAAFAVFLGCGINSEFFVAKKRQDERSRRRNIRDAAKRRYDDAIDQIQREGGPKGFSAKKRELENLRKEHMQLTAAEKQELNALHVAAQDQQRQKFLGTCIIDKASIPGIGAARKASLRSVGIETAADVSFNRVCQVRGFGGSLVNAVVDWRTSCEHKFVFNSATAISASDKKAIALKFGAKLVVIEGLLKNGASELQKFQAMSAVKANILQSILADAAAQFAQAESDFSLL